MKKDTKNPLYAKLLIKLIRPFPNFDFWFIKSVRKKAVESLELKSKDRVLDAGCGSGGSFQYLYQKVGPEGEIIGVEISPMTVINTKKRIARNKWYNVHVIEADANIVNLSGKFNGLLTFAAPDVFASENALSNILPYMEERARVAIFGAKISNRRFGWLLNGALRLAFSKLSFPSTPTIENKPWIVLEKYTETLHIDEYFFGWMFLAYGTLTNVKNT